LKVGEVSTTRGKAPDKINLECGRGQRLKRAARLNVLPPRRGKGPQVRKMIGNVQHGVKGIEGRKKKAFTSRAVIRDGESASKRLGGHPSPLELFEGSAKSQGEIK